MIMVDLGSAQLMAVPLCPGAHRSSSHYVPGPDLAPMGDFFTLHVFRKKALSTTFGKYEMVKSSPNTITELNTFLIP